MKIHRTILEPALELQRIQNKANSFPEAGVPDFIGASWVAKGVTNDLETTTKGLDGHARGWRRHHRSVLRVYDTTDPTEYIPTDDYDLDLSSLAELTEAEEPDPGKRAEHAALIAQRLARLTGPERATVALALAQGGGGGTGKEVLNNGR